MSADTIPAHPQRQAIVVGHARYLEGQDRDRTQCDNCDAQGGAGDRAETTPCPVAKTGEHCMITPRWRRNP